MVKIFSEEMKKFILDNYKGITKEELTNKLNNKFNLEFTKIQIARFMQRHKLNNGIDIKNAFQKGNIPWNKGKKMSKETKLKIIASKTLFKKGQKAINSLPIGTERYDKDGYIEIKVQGDKYKSASNRGIVAKDNTRWIPKQRKVWIDNYGEIPPKHKIVFLDKNKYNFDIKNLYCIPNNIISTMNKKHRFSEFDSITKTAITLTKLEKSILERNKLSS